jgi:hypothetical protein
MRPKASFELARAKVIVQPVPLPEGLPSMSVQQHDCLVSKLLASRLLIGFLGERAQFGWWPTAFYEPSARLFLEPVFPKTIRIAQYHGVVEAARRLHDEHLNVGSFHLFRLPEELEQDLHRLMQSRANELSGSDIYKDKRTALEALGAMVGAMNRKGVGPVAIGSVREIATKADELLSVYRSAFLSGATSFPYLVS